MKASRNRRSRTNSTSSGRNQLIQTTPQAAQQPLEAPKIIVIHPGSQHLRIGRAADLNPLTILHAVAYKRTQVEGDWPYHDQLLPPLENTNPTQMQVEFEEQRLSVSRMLQHCVVDQQNRLRVSTPPQQLANFNRRSLGEKVPPPSHISEEEQAHWIDYEASALFDEQILRLSSFDARNYDIHFPIRRGELNVHKEKGGSLQATLMHLERIWSYALGRLKIPLDQLDTHSAVLVINDVYIRSHLREAVTLLLQRMGFQRCFLVQDSVASTYGAGLGYACVVDIGAQKTSISCIEDGISQQDSRVRLNYGGGDINQVLLMLLRKCAFPYRECNVQDSYVDAHLLDELKQRFCHMHLKVYGAQEKQFALRKPNGHWQRYTLQVGDEVIIAPLALFHTKLLGITGKTCGVYTQQSVQEQYDSEDCFDAEYLRETTRRNGARTGDNTMRLTGQQGQMNDADDDMGDNEDAITSVGSTQASSSNSCYYTPSGEVLSLDMAIIRSIGRCPSYETKRKMFATILLVGSSVKMPGLAAWLEEHISRQVPDLEVNVFSKGMDVGMVAWKGAAIMSVLESAHELWISRREWKRYGLRILRERSPFLW